MTLVELLVAITIVGTGLAIAGVTRSALTPTTTQRVLAQLADARARAIASGAPITLVVANRSVRFSPDGSTSPATLKLDSAILRIESLTGQVLVNSK